jgi:REP-associated tyrosine transposase
VPRQPRSALGDGLFHVTARGNAGMKIYLDETDYRTFLALMRDVARQHSWTLFAYCLMPNHFHLVVRARGSDLSAGMSALNGTYGRRFNRRHRRYGHLFQGRYGTRLIDEERRLDVRDYVMENPVRAGLVADADDYPWSALLVAD